MCIYYKKNMFVYLQNKFVLSAIITLGIVFCIHIYKKNTSTYGDYNSDDEEKNKLKEYGQYALITFAISLLSMFSMQFMGCGESKPQQIGGGGNPQRIISPVKKTHDNFDYIIGEPDF